MCNANDLLVQNPCLAAYPTFIMQVLEAQGYCAIAIGGFTPPGDNAWTNPQDDGDWTNPDGSGTFTNPQP